MYIQQLKYFIAVAEHLNFTEASKQYYIAQSAISYHISDLEKHLDVKLFTRDKRSVQLTAAGRVLLQEAYNLINHHETVIKKTQQASQGILGCLKIGVLGVRVINQLPHFLREFRSTYPNVEIDLEQMNAEQLTEALESGRIDVGFTRASSIQYHPNLIGDQLYIDPISVVLHKNHPLADSAILNLTDLAEDNFVSINRQQSPGLFDLLIELCSGTGFSPKIISQPHQVEALLCLIESGVGISLLPNCFNSKCNPELRFIPLENNKASIDLTVAWRKDSTNRSIALFINKLKEVYTNPKKSVF